MADIHGYVRMHTDACGCTTDAYVYAWIHEDAYAYITEWMHTDAYGYAKGAQASVLASPR